MSSLVEEIASFSNLLRAWKTIRRRLAQEEYLFSLLIWKKISFAFQML
jgi:hypothetical protein